MHSGIVEEWWEWKTALLAISSFTPYFGPGKQRSTTNRRRREDWFLWNGGQSLYVCGKGLVNQKMSGDESEYVVQKEQFTCPKAGTLWNGPEFVHLRRIMNTTKDGVGLLVGPWPWSSLLCTFSCRNWSSFQVHLLPRPDKETPFRCKIQAIRLTSPRHGNIRADFLICKPVGCSGCHLRKRLYYVILPHEIRIYDTGPLHATKKYHWLFTTCFAQTAHSSRKFSLFLIWDFHAKIQLRVFVQLNNFPPFVRWKNWRNWRTPRCETKIPLRCLTVVTGDRPVFSVNFGERGYGRPIYRPPEIFGEGYCT